MNDRSIQLHIRTPNDRQDFSMGAGNAQSGPMTAQDGSAERFKQALLKSADLMPATDPASQETQQIGSPMNLFGVAPTAATPALNPGVMNLLKNNIKGLQVGQEQRSVRMELDDTLYPGVNVSVFEDAGALVAEFRCTEKQSYLSLAEPAQEMARQMADEINRDALWRVIDESEGPVVDFDIDHTCEAFASAPEK